MALADILNDDLISFAVDLSRYSVTLQKKVLNILKQLEADVIDKLQSVTDIERADKLRAFLIGVEKTITKAYDGVDTVVLSDLTALAKLAQTNAVTSFKSAIKVDILNTKLIPAQLKALAQGALIQGAPSEEWWDRQSQSLTRAFNDAMRTGVLAGETIPQLVSRVRGVATGRRVAYLNKDGTRKYWSEFSGGILDTSTRAASALVRTSVANVNNVARQALYEANADVIQGVQAVVTLDGRTTQICRGHASAMWSVPDYEPMNEVTPRWHGPPPWHFNCRTLLVPVTESWEDLAKRAGGDVAAAKSMDVAQSSVPKMRASMDGEVAADLSYDDWLKTKSVAFQKEVLGPGKWELWQSGELSMFDMLDTSGRPLTLAELQARVGG